MRTLLLASGLALATLMTAQAQTPPVAPSAAASMTDASLTPNAAAIDPALAGYKLGAGDRLRIIVFGEPALTGEFVVNGEGYASLPLIGEVQAAGRTVPQLQDSITARLSDGFVREPRVSAEVLNYRPFYILGEVTKPGTYPYSAGLTVMNAVATANGFTYRANTNKVWVRRQGEKEEVAVKLDPTATVAPGDTIRVGERFF